MAERPTLLDWLVEHPVEARGILSRIERHIVHVRDQQEALITQVLELGREIDKLKKEQGNGQRPAVLRPTGRTWWCW